jgi:hypothetical protein
MSRRIIFVDLDRTIFDTNQFMVSLWEAASQLYPNTDVVYEVSRIREWYRAVGDLQYYLFDQHLHHATGAAFEKIAPELRRRLQHEQFAFPDTAAITSWAAHGYDVRILSFGAQDFQAFKLSLIPQFDQPRDIILEAKGAFITEHFPGVTGFMVDDKRNLSLPAGVREVWLRRAGEQDINKESDMITIKSLKEVEELL